MATPRKEKKTVQQTNLNIIRAVNGRLGAALDDLHRAQSTNLHMTPDRRLLPYGESGKTIGEIIFGYEEEVAIWREALEEASR